MWWVSHDIEAVLDESAKWKQIEIPAPHMSGPFNTLLIARDQGTPCPDVYVSPYIYHKYSLSPSTPSHFHIPITPPYVDNLFPGRSELELLM